MQFYTLLILQVLVGFSMGFYFSDKKMGLSVREFQFSAIAILLIMTYLAVTKPVLTFVTITFAIASAAILFIGLLIGDYTRCTVEKRIQRKVQKEEIHKLLGHFARNATEATVAKDINEKSKLDIEMYSALSSLHETVERVDRLGHTDLAEQVRSFVRICESVARLSKKINNEKDERYEDYMKALRKSLELSGDMMESIEGRLNVKLCSTWATISLGAKTVHMR